MGEGTSRFRWENMIVKPSKLLKGIEENVMGKAVNVRNQLCFKLMMFSWCCNVKHTFYLAGLVQFDFCFVSVQYTL